MRTIFNFIIEGTMAAFSPPFNTFPFPSPFTIVPSAMAVQPH